MEKSGGVKIEGLADSQSSSSAFDSSSSPGFMDLLGLQDVVPSLIFDSILQVPWLEAPSPSAIKAPHDSSPEVLNQLPTTPNSSSVSSDSNEAGASVNDDHRQRSTDKSGEGDQEEERNAKKQLKPKKTGQKRQRQPRFAFMTKSEVDFLEDGYRWRKYGQKAVKNSPFPRSYYRCTSSTCNVKKRVERCFSDPSNVVTTYEGQHTHPSPMMPRGRNAAGVLPDYGFSAGGAAAFAMPTQLGTNALFSDYFQQPPYNGSMNGCFQSLSFSHVGSISSSKSTSLEDKSSCTPTNADSLSDNGLLQDIVPSILRKQQG
ncbi:hypothetical protein Nepgr_027585 [Nepenthes gracilis]|uniref:WRKY transcription factor n=1 Tax=Nepenthes gracilis TaxID=150966 RepID=A0AAD3TBZ8_NEPGR|nr:hypothetical protein Nepgr_027585 [Nepenthes gracilis]